MLTKQLMSTLFLFAHPDDEFFCLPIIQREQSFGSHVVCVYLTDGGYNGQSIERRKAETIAALDNYGVNTEDIHFIGAEVGIPDGELHKYLELAHSTLETKCKNLSLQRVFLPAWEGGHQDHDACHAIGVILCSNLGLTYALRQFSLYNGYQCRYLFKVMRALPNNGPVERVNVSLGSALRYLGTVRHYPSQWKTWLGLLPFAALQVLRSRNYVLQMVNVDRIKERPHPGMLLYERRTSVRHEDIATLLGNLQDRLR